MAKLILGTEVSTNNTNLRFLDDLSTPRRRIKASFARNVYWKNHLYTYYANKKVIMCTDKYKEYSRIRYI